MLIPHRYAWAAAVAAVLVSPGGVALAEEAQASCEVGPGAFKYVESSGPGRGGLPFEIRSYWLGADAGMETALVRSDGTLVSLARAEGDVSWLAERWLRRDDLEPETRQDASESLSEYLPKVVRITELCGGRIETAELIGERAEASHVEAVLERLQAVGYDPASPSPGGYLRLEPLPNALIGARKVDRDFDDGDVAGFWEELLEQPGKLLSVEALAASDPQVRDHGLDPGGNRIVKHAGHLFVLAYYE